MSGGTGGKAEDADEEEVVVVIVFAAVVFSCTDLLLLLCTRGVCTLPYAFLVLALPSKILSFFSFSSLSCNAMPSSRESNDDKMCYCTNESGTRLLNDSASSFNWVCAKRTACTLSLHT